MSPLIKVIIIFCEKNQTFLMDKFTCACNELLYENQCFTCRCMWMAEERKYLRINVYV